MSTRRILSIAATLVAILATALAGSLTAAQHDHGDATPDAHGDHMVATPGHDNMGMSGTGVIYMTIENTGDEDDALIGASTERAQLVEVHETRIENDIGTMLPHEGPLVIPAGESVALEPAGLHIMLVGLNDDIRLGDTFDITLEFERAGKVTMPVTAVLGAEDAEGETVEAGDLEISGVWSRPAPRIDGAAPATPEASPGA
jgi:hypothetical protein